jgi:hypothetical protein
VVGQLAGQNIRAIKRIDPNQMKRFDSMKSYCITLGTSNVATISKVSVRARRIDMAEFMEVWVLK